MRRGRWLRAVSSRDASPSVKYLKVCGSLRSDRVVDRFDQCGPRHRADELFLHFAALDAQQILMPRTAVASGSLRIVVDVIFTTLSRPEYSPARSSMSGAIARHGAHTRRPEIY